MPRGRSMRPHGARSPPSVPADLQNSLFAVPAFALQAAPADGGKTAAAVASAVQEAALEQVRVFDDAGNLTTRQVGISVFHFRPLTLFYRMRAQSWAWLLSFSVVSYLTIVLSISVMYYAWSAICGAAHNTSFIVSLYFTVVSLAANGGYMGEDMVAMTNATHVCYTGRTMIVMLCSYVNILFVGLVAALVVSKATYTGTLSNRIVFSDYCSLTRVPCRETTATTTTTAGAGAGTGNHRHRNVHNNSRISKSNNNNNDDDDGSEPHTTKASKCEGCGRSSGRGGGCNAQWRLCFRMANMENKQPLAHGQLRLFCVTAEPLKEYRQERRVQRYKRRVAQRRRQQQQQRQKQEQQKQDEAKEEDDTTTQQQQQQQQEQQQQSQRSPNETSYDSARTNSSVSTQREAQFLSDTVEMTSPQAYNAPPATATLAGRYGTLQTRSSAAAAAAATTNDTAPLLQRQQGQQLPQTAAPSSSLASPPLLLVGGAHGDGTDDDATATVVVAAAAAASSSSMTAEHAHYHAMPEDAMERVRVNVCEMLWSCPEETYLDHRVRGQVSLWYPATITHLVDEHSPLYRFVEAAMQDAADGNGSFSNALTGTTTATSAAARARHAGVLSRKFQIVAVFSATEMETGSTIMAKHTYIASDIVTDAKFSSKLVHMQPYRGDVLLDYHYFNELLPMTVSESSTTDSDSA